MAPSFMTKTTRAGGGDVGEGVSGEGDEVGELAGFEGPDRFREAEQLGVDGGRGLQGGERGHPVADHQGELSGVLAVFGDSGVGPEADLDPELQGLGEGLRERVVRGDGLGGDLGREPGEVRHQGVGGHQGGDQVRPPLLHQLEGVVREERPVLDRVDPGEHRVPRGLVAVAVAGDLLAEPMGLVAEGGHLGEGELGGVDPRRPARGRPPRRRT